MIDRTALLGALDVITATRRDVMADLDTAQATQLAATEPAADEELVQTLGALRRQLDTAARELTDAIRTCDQRTRVMMKGDS